MTLVVMIPHASLLTQPFLYLLPLALFKLFVCKPHLLPLLLVRRLVILGPVDSLLRSSGDMVIQLCIRIVFGLLTPLELCFGLVIHVELVGVLVPSQVAFVR